MLSVILQHYSINKGDLIVSFQCPPPSADHLRSVALSTITSFAEWVDFKTLFMQECKLLKLLYTFINIEDLKTSSCECLLNIVSRKVLSKINIIYYVIGFEKILHNMYDQHVISAIRV